MIARSALRERQAVIVVDLGFGDAGKGLVTDALVRALGARTVVRFNGGAQAGHNVVTPDGRHHTFAQLGAGSFVPGTRTHLTADVVVHPTALLVEARHLARAGVTDALERLTVSSGALLITPVQQAAARLRELCRGEARHGSCGVGVGEARRDALAAGAEPLRMGDLRDPPRLLRALRREQARKRAELDEELRALGTSPAALPERRLLEEPGPLEAWLEAVAALPEGIVTGEERLGALLAEPSAVIFEGAQGVLLDEDAGFHPFTSWSRCTFANALGTLRTLRYDGVTTRLGVLRSYAVRHGPGPFPTEDPTLLPLLPERHNADGPWQGPVRLGWPDLLLQRYALAACGGADALAITHLDALERLPSFRLCTAYAQRRAPGAPELPEGEGGSESSKLRNEGSRLFDRSGDDVRALRLATPPDLTHQEALGRALLSVAPRYEELPRSPDDLLARLEDELGVPVRLRSSGPTAADVSFR